MMHIHHLSIYTDRIIIVIFGIIIALNCTACTASSKGPIAPKPEIVGPEAKGATPGSAIPLEPVSPPEKGEIQAGTHLGGAGSTAVGWKFPGAPPDGVDAVRITISPRSSVDSLHNYIYWAWDSFFKDGSTYYFGLQPASGLGKTALFSVFGPGTSWKNPNCKSGADGGAGSGCHIRYPWEYGRAYQFSIVLIASDETTATWEGSVVDLSNPDAKAARTVIGEITVPRSRGYLKSWGVTFAEYYRRPTPCGEQPGSEALFYRPVAYRNGQELPGTLVSLEQNSGCNPRFYSDGKNFAYVDVGQ